MRPLDGMRILTLAVNVPGPLAAARLQSLGATVVKIEPPSGDPLAHVAPDWYAELTAGQEILTLNLKDPSASDRLAAYLAQADLLLTATRPAALARLGLSWPELHERYPQLCQVLLTGYPAPAEGRAGHDLTYQAQLGLVTPPELPRTLLADLAGAERIVSAALGLLLARARGGGGALQQVALSSAAAPFADPLRHGLTTPDGPLGGGLASYALYRTTAGWVALAALEPHFWQRLCEELGLPIGAGRAELARVLRTRSAAEWERWAEERDLPLAAVRSGYG